MPSVENVPDVVEVVCGDKSYLVPVHKLAAKSQFFARAFEVPMAEKMWRKVILKDFDEKVFEKVVKYIVELFWVVGRPGPQFSTSKLPSEITSCSEAFRPTWSSSESTEYLQDSNSRVCEKKPC